MSSVGYKTYVVRKYVVRRYVNWSPTYINVQICFLQYYKYKSQHMIAVSLLISWASEPGAFW